MTITTTRANPPLTAAEVISLTEDAIARVDGQVGNREITGLSERHIEALVIVALYGLSVAKVAMREGPGD